LARKWWTLVTVCLGILMLLLDITIVNVALPSIARDLKSSFSDLQWTIDAYALSLAALLLVSGSLGDLLGHRRLFGTGLMIFSVSSLACGLAPDPTFLNVCRAVQGIGAAGMFASSLALIGNEFHGRDRGTALGVWGATAGAAVAVGPLIGGALTSGINWRWIFFVNVPIGVLTIGLLLVKVSDTRRRAVRPDWPGALAFSGALFAFVFGLIRGNPDGWTSEKVLTAFIAGAALLTLFVVIELVRDDPMLDLGLFRKPAIVGTTLGTIALSAAIASVFLYMTLYFQNVLGYSAFQAGLRFLPVTLAVMVAAPVAGKLSEHVPVRLLIGGGLALMAAGLALMTRVDVTSGWTALLAGSIIVGLGNGTAQPARGAAALGTVPREKAGVGSGLNNTALQVGIAGGIAGLGAVFQSHVKSVFVSQLSHVAPTLAGARGHALASHVSAGSPGQALRALPPNLRHPVSEALRVAFVSGFDRILWVAAAVALAGGVLALLLVRRKDFEAPPGQEAIPQEDEARTRRSPALVGGRT
jgi:EmrB/QacA subfamily drug resistance transporter